MLKNNEVILSVLQKYEDCKMRWESDLRRYCHESPKNIAINVFE